MSHIEIKDPNRDCVARVTYDDDVVNISCGYYNDQSITLSYDQLRRIAAIAKEFKGDE